MFDIAAAEATLNDNFAAWVLALEPRVAACGDGAAVLEIPITESIARVGGMVCGQALGALADTAMVLAASSQMGGFRPIATTNLETRFLSAGTGDAIRCEARIIRAGRALIFAEAALLALPKGKPVAAASATYFIPPA